MLHWRTPRNEFCCHLSNLVQIGRIRNIQNIQKTNYLALVFEIYKLLEIKIKINSPSPDHADYDNILGFYHMSKFSETHLKSQIQFTLFVQPLEH